MQENTEQEKIGRSQVSQLNVAVSKKGISYLLLAALFLSLVQATGLVGSLCAACARQGWMHWFAWFGCAFYALLSWCSWRRHWGLVDGMLVIAIVCHALLVHYQASVESYCFLCLLVAFLALAAAAIRGIQHPAALRVFAGAFLVGSLLTFLNPVERVAYAMGEGQLVIGSSASIPKGITAKDLLSCGHDRPICVTVYETSNCPTCSSLRRQIVPILQKDYADQVCVHDIAVGAGEPREGNVSTMLVAEKATREIRVVKGIPSRKVLHSLLNRAD